ncbi:sugar ABC transporter substrate-binding protein [Rhodococcus sp. 06-462-5]|uniref:sugar ABC transporter substrate-binding protein n=1 Tax=Nocardiaceae TaxID=85025 RepID=UPI00068CC283|nr:MULTISPECIES: sugar ABC transporter substrate-binding protein [Rhodococcus]OZC73997.1 sugar ABC transporter substrate-binding protein [Rhodococcus sp. 06-462-5]OZE67993.1 sugar ABC transporter substrate-binding protein [Rhodococcus sp. 02-925g]OZF51986.1 sugar ABC transporter substrate-binding protein [Rhodococcus sp. 14-1411-2a]
MRLISQRTFRTASALAVTALGIGTLAGCGTGPNSGAIDNSGPLKVGISVPALDTPFFSILIDEATSAAEAAGGEVVQTTNANRSSGQQVTDIRNLITAGANSIMAGVVDRDAIKPALDYAASRNVPVVVVDDKPSAGTAYAVVKADNYAMGVSAAEQMGQRLPGGGKVLNITGDIATSNGRDRSAGFTDTIAEKFPDIDVIEQPANWSGPRAGSVMQTVLSENADLAGVYLASDTLYLDPVAAALNGRGRSVPVGAPGHVTLVSVDGGKSAMDAVRAGTLDAAIVQPVPEYSKISVDYLGQGHEGVSLAAGPTEHGSEVVEQDGFLVDLLPAPVVTRENADDPSLWGNQ